MREKQYRLEIEDDTIPYDAIVERDHLDDIYRRGIWHDPEAPNVCRVLLDGELLTKERLEKILEPAELEYYQIYRDYPEIGEQLDIIFHELADTGKLSPDGVWATTIRQVKEGTSPETVTGKPVVPVIVVQDDGDSIEA